MISAGAIKGFDWPYINTVTPTATMTDDDYRLYYAAFYNDVNTAAGLYKKGWRSTYDIDGRDPLHVAASMGSFEFVQFFAEHNSALMVLDSRGNYSVDDAEDFVHLDSHLFLDAIVMDGFIKSNCAIY